MAMMPWEETYQKEAPDTSNALPWEQTYAKPKEEPTKEKESGILASAKAGTERCLVLS